MTPRATSGTGAARFKTPEYQALHMARQRCHNPKNRKYKNYGARGIEVCPQWRARNGFHAFFAEVGPRPSPTHSLDRKDVNKNYEPGNVRWATCAEQANNKTNHTYATVRLEHVVRQGVRAAADAQGMTVRAFVNEALTRTIQALAYGSSKRAA